MEELDLPLKRNQVFIVNAFSKVRERFCDHLLGFDEEKKQKRIELLTKVNIRMTTDSVIYTECVLLLFYRQKTVMLTFAC